MSETNCSRTRWLHIRLTPEEYNKIHKHFEKTTCRKLSEYIRKFLLEKPLTTRYRDQSIDDLMAESIKLRNELNSIGNNFNQSVKRLHTLQQVPEFKGWIIGFNADKEVLFDKVEEIKNNIQKIAEKWLQ